MPPLVIDDKLSGPEFADISVCPECDRAKARWMEANPDNAWAKVWRTQGRQPPELATTTTPAPP